MQGATGERRMHGYATLNDMKRRKLREKEKHWCEGFRKEKKRLKYTPYLSKPIQKEKKRKNLSQEARAQPP